MRIRLVNASGSYVLERDEILYGEESCQYASHEVLNDAPYRVAEEYICNDESAVLVYSYEETNEQIYRRATIYLTFKTKNEELVKALAVIIDLLKKGKLRASSVFIEFADTEDEVVEAEKQELKEKLKKLIEEVFDE